MSSPIQNEVYSLNQHEPKQVMIIPNSENNPRVQQVQSKYRKIVFAEDPIQSEETSSPLKSIRIIASNRTDLQDFTKSPAGGNEPINSSRSIWIKSIEEHRFPRLNHSQSNTSQSVKLLKKSKTKSSFHSEASVSKLTGGVLHPKSSRDIPIGLPFDSSILQQEQIQKCIENASSLLEFKQPNCTKEFRVEEQSSVQVGIQKKSNKSEAEQSLDTLDPLSRYLKQKEISDKNHQQRQSKLKRQLRSQPTQSSQFIKHLGTQAKLASFEEKITQASTIINDLLYKVNQELDSGSPTQAKQQVKSIKNPLSHQKNSKSVSSIDNLPEIKRQGSFLSEKEQGSVYQNLKSYLFTERPKMESSYSRRSMRNIDEKKNRQRSSLSLNEIQNQGIIERCSKISKSMFENLEKLKSSSVSKKRLTSFMKQCLPGSSLLRSFLLEEFRDYPAKLKDNTNPDSLRTYLLKQQQQQQSVQSSTEILQQFQSELTRLDLKLNDLLMQSQTAQCDKFESDIINSCRTVEEQLKRAPMKNNDNRIENASKVVESLSFNRLANKAHSVVTQMQSAIIKYGSLDRINQETFKIASTLETNIHKIIEARKNQIKKRYIFASADLDKDYL